VEHYINLKKDGTYTQYYKNGETEITESSTWRRINDAHCMIELWKYSVYKASDVDDYFGETLGAKRANILFFVNEEDFRITRHGSVHFIKEPFVAKHKRHRAQVEAYWADKDTLYYDTGEIKEIGKLINYKPKDKRGIWEEFYKNGNLKAKGSYVDLKEGIWKFYYNSGELKAVGSYENSLKAGPWEYYHENGKIKETGIYIYIYTDTINPLRKRDKWKYYNSKGKLIRTKKYPSVEKTLDSFYKTLGWDEQFISENIKETKKDWYTPMEEYKKEQRKQDSIKKLKK